MWAEPSEEQGANGLDYEVMTVPSSLPRLGQGYLVVRAQIEGVLQQFRRARDAELRTAGEPVPAEFAL